jgi:hypothetical protein
VAVFTKYDVLYEGLKPKIEEDFYGDIEEDIEHLNDVVDPGGTDTGTSAPPIDLEVTKLGVPWVEVSGLDICLSF